MMAGPGQCYMSGFEYFACNTSIEPSNFHAHNNHRQMSFRCWTHIACSSVEAILRFHSSLWDLLASGDTSNASEKRTIKSLMWGATQVMFIFWRIKRSNRFHEWENSCPMFLFYGKTLLESTNCLQLHNWKKQRIQEDGNEKDLNWNRVFLHSQQRADWLNNNRFNQLLLVNLLNWVNLSSHPPALDLGTPKPEKFPKRKFQNDFRLVYLFSSVPRSWEPVYMDDSFPIE